MKRTVLFVALAAAGMSAMAQSSVTLYGRLNTTLERQTNISQDGTAKVMANNASRWGLRGTEDLGGGLKAGFVVESGFASDEGRGASRLFGRQSEVNLAGGFGMIRLGNFVPESYFATADYVSMHNHDTGTSSDALYDFSTWTDANKIAYRTPDMGGFTAEIAVASNEAGSAQGGAGRGYDLAANYNLDKLHVGAGYSKVSDMKQFAVSALYDFGFVVLGGYIQRSDIGGFKPKAYRLSAMVPVGAMEFHGNIGAVSDGGVAENGAKQMTAGINYNLSQRTKVYGYYTTVNNELNSDRMASSMGLDAKSFAVGVRHNF